MRNDDVDKANAYVTEKLFRPGAESVTVYGRNFRMPPYDKVGDAAPEGEDLDSA